MYAYLTRPAFAAISPGRPPPALSPGYATQAFGDIALYDGQDIEAVWQRLEREWWSQALLRPIQHTRIEIRYTRARLALALAMLRPSADWLRRARVEAKP